MQIDFEHGAAAIVAGIVGGVLTKLVSIHMKKMEIESAESTRLRTDVTKRYEEMSDELKTVRKELEFWRDKYHLETMAQKQETAILKVEVTALHIQLRDIKSRDWIPQKDKERYE